MYEHRTQPLLRWEVFLRRAFRHVIGALALVTAADAAGTVGYHLLGGLGWVDAFLNASMILGGMGPVDRMDAAAAKIFAACYALFSGLVFIAVMAVILTPWLHRLIHKIHLEGR